MERSSKRGKIPQSDWPLIIKRYESGETLAAIARTYDCSPPAISYILSRSRARDSAADGALQSAIEPSQPGLIKPVASETPLSAGQDDREIDGAAPLLVETQAASPVEVLGGEPLQVGLTRSPDRQAEAPDGRADIVSTGAHVPTAQLPAEIRDSLHPPREGNSLNNNLERSILLPQNNEARRTLHLPLSQHSNQRSYPQVHDTRDSDRSENAATQPVRGEQQASLPTPSRQHPDYTAANSRGTIRTATAPNKAKEGGPFIDRALRERVDEDIAAFLAAFDAALADDSLENRLGLREATDRLLRAGARTRIELERLEARMPLSTRK